MRILRICSFLIILSTLIYAQTIGQWKIYSDMKNINASVISGGSIFSATNGGTFKFNFSDSSYSIITKSDGLNSQALTAIGIDNENKIWFGSLEGYINILDQNDNSIYKIVDIFNSNKTKKQINNIFVKGDTLFASIDFGLSLINTKTFSFYDSFLKLGNFSAEAKVLSAYKSNLIFVCTESGVAVQKVGAQNLSAPESWDTYILNADISAQSLSKCVGFNGQVLLATSNGIFTFVNKQWQPFILSGYSVVDMIVSGNSLYIITATKLFKYTGGQPIQLYENKNVVFNSVTVTNGQVVYISTNNGLIEYSTTKTKFRYPNGPLSNSFMNLSVDPLGNLWVATGKDNGGTGFAKFDRSVWTIYNTSTNSQIKSNAYFNVYAGPDTTVYLSNWGFGVTVLKNNTFTFYSKNNSSISGFVNDTNFVPISDIKTDSKGNMWVLVNQPATRKPLSVMTKQNKWYSYSFLNYYVGSDPTGSMVIDQYDTKWFVLTVNNRGLYYFNENKTFETLTDDIQGYIGMNDGLLSDLISCLAVDKKGYIWIGTNVGVNVITDPSKPKVTNNLGLALRNQAVTCITVDPLDNKWIGTKQGIFVLSSDGIQVLDQYNTSNSPLPNDDIKSITFDAKNGIVYVGTDNGLASLQTSSIQPLSSFEKLNIYPNPFIIGNGVEPKVTIEGLVKNSNIKIFSITGNLILEMNTPGGKIAFWDGKDLNGNYVQSGIYIVVAFDEEANNVATSKIAVLRK